VLHHRRRRHPKLPITSSRLHALLVESGGFTIRRRTGHQRRHGVCVATRPHKELAFPIDDWRSSDVDDWLGSIRGERRWRASHIGGWVDQSSGRVVLDVVRVVPCRLQRMAVVVGRVTRQDFAFNLSEQRVMVLR
jgi:hypothetical protein